MSARTSAVGLSLALALACVPSSEHAEVPAAPAPAPAGEPVVFIEAAPEPARREARDEARDEARHARGDARPAADEDAREVAKQQFMAGVERYEAGDYEDALAHFQQAYALAPMPELLWNIARCQVEVGEVAGACASYAQLLTETNSDSLREAASKGLADLGC